MPCDGLSVRGPVHLLILRHASPWLDAGPHINAHMKGNAAGLYGRNIVYATWLGGMAASCL